jgi:phosphoglycerate dehydrogenase-like enzyme
MTPRCAILDDYQNVALTIADWAPLADRVDVRAFNRHLATDDELVAAIGDCAIVVAMRERTPFPRALLARLPNLKLLVTTGMRNASIDIEAAADHGIVVCGTPTCGQPAAELTWALILALLRRLPQESAAFRAGGAWQSTIGNDLAGKQLGVIGLGKLGTRVAAVGKAFGMNVAAWSRNLTADRCAAAGVTFAASLDALLESSEVVTLHLVLSARTQGLLGERELKRMKPTAVLINTSRGPLVDEPALIAALTAGTIAGAGLDVFDAEPLPPGHPFRTLPNVVATPHLGYVTAENYRTLYTGAVEDIVAWLDGTPIRVVSANSAVLTQDSVYSKYI